ncbi:ScbR family autoregulator-binding transcription factor [Streptomyces sp. NPDC050147]|uniref:ScbR family autoregulator-binding transcription factor n=1 Tax=Streptomyces sp. NPDC050147 TaxID=3155513 RepID=UPI00341DF215
MVKQERAARTRELLVRAAAEAFAREGFIAASLTTISKRAGVSNGALHFHFESKSTLARAVEDEAAAVLCRLARGGDPRAGALQRLVDATYHLMRRLDQDVVVRAGFELSNCAALRDRSIDLRGQWQHWIEQVLQEAEHQGELAAGVPAADAATVVAAAMVGFEMLGARDRHRTSTSRLLPFWQLMLPRLAAPGLLKQVEPAGTPRTAPPQPPT